MQTRREFRNQDLRQISYVELNETPRNGFYTLTVVAEGNVHIFYYEDFIRALDDQHLARVSMDCLALPMNQTEELYRFRCGQQIGFALMSEQRFKDLLQIDRTLFRPGSQWFDMSLRSIDEFITYEQMYSKWDKTQVPRGLIFSQQEIDQAEETGFVSVGTFPLGKLNNQPH